MVLRVIRLHPLISVQKDLQHRAKKKLQYNVSADGKKEGCIASVSFCYHCFKTNCSDKSAPRQEVIPPLAPSARAVRVPSRDPSPAPGQKRRANSESEENGKSKNVRNHPRGSAGAALTSLAIAFTHRNKLTVLMSPVQ